MGVLGAHLGMGFVTGISCIGLRASVFLFEKTVLYHLLSFLRLMSGLLVHSFLSCLALNTDSTVLVTQLRSFVLPQESLTTGKKKWFFLQIHCISQPVLFDLYSLLKVTVRFYKAIAKIKLQLNGLLLGWEGTDALNSRVFPWKPVLLNAWKCLVIIIFLCLFLVLKVE